MSYDQTKKQRVIADYRLGVLTTAEVAAKHGVSAPTVTLWAREARLPVRARGRKRYQTPTARQIKIIESVRNGDSYAKAGSPFGLCRQSVARMVHRWKHYQAPRTPPFAKGDVIGMNKQVYTVMLAEVETGILLNHATKKVERSYRWNSQGETPKLLGTDPELKGRIRHKLSALV